MRKLVGVSTSVLSLLFGMAGTVSASAPTHAQATGPGESQTQTLVRTADGNSTYSAVDTLTFTGGIIGAPTDIYTYTVHPNGSITGNGMEVCSLCTIGGRTGSYTQRFSFTATPDFATFQGQFAFVSSGGGLAGLHGEGTFQGAATSATGFSEIMQLNYSFEP